MNVPANRLAELSVAFISGLIFALGLALSQMVNPAKVLNFLDVFGRWDPTLAFVMGGAVLVTAPTYFFVLKRNQPIFTEKFHVPNRNDIDARLILGSIIFGVGWGMAGLCPGPALTAITSGLVPIIAFVFAMTLGMFVFSSLERVKQ